MTASKKNKSIVWIALLILSTIFCFIPSGTKANAAVIPRVEFVNAPVTQYKVGDRVRFDIYSPNYLGKVEYRVVLWNNAKKTYYDLWNAGNGYPNRYYSKWQPKGNDIFTLGWIINESGSYRITVYVKRVGILPSEAALKEQNCDSYMESIAFEVKPKQLDIQSLLPLPDIIVGQGSTPILPSTVKAIMSDGAQKDLKVSWGYIDTSKMGAFLINGAVEGTNKKISLTMLINQGTLNINTINATGTAEIHINLKEEINYIPSINRFAIKSAFGLPVRVNSISVSEDKKVIKLLTEYMIPGSLYIITAEGRDYTFIIPYTNGTTDNRYSVSITAVDREIALGGTTIASVNASPYDSVLSYLSYNENIATVDQYTGLIKGVSRGTATILVTASKAGYITGWTTFRVRVYSSIIQHIPNIADMVNIGDQYILPSTVSTVMSDGTTQAVAVKSWLPSYVNTSQPGVYTFKGTVDGYSGYFTLTLKVGTKVWIIDRSLSRSNYYYNPWGGPFEINLSRTYDDRRVIKISSLSAAMNNNQNDVLNYGDVTFIETGYRSGWFTTTTWGERFQIEEYKSWNEHSIRLKGDWVELRILNPLDSCSHDIQNWFLIN